MECKLVSAPRHFERSMQISGTPLSSCFTRRFKGRSQLAVPSILFLDQHFLHTVQPLPSSSSVIYPLSHVLQIAERFYQTPRLASLPEELRNSWVLSLPGSYPSSSLLRTLPPPSRHPSSSRFQPVIGRTCSRVFLSGTRKVSPVAQHALVTVLSLPPRRSAMPLRSARDMSCCLRPEPGGSAFGSLFFFEATCGFTFVTAR